MWVTHSGVFYPYRCIQSSINLWGIRRDLAGHFLQIPFESKVHRNLIISISALSRERADGKEADEFDQTRLNCGFSIDFRSEPIRIAVSTSITSARDVKVNLEGKKRKWHPKYAEESPCVGICAHGTWSWTRVVILCVKNRPKFKPSSIDHIHCWHWQTLLSKVLLWRFTFDQFLLSFGFCCVILSWVFNFKGIVHLKTKMLLLFPCYPECSCHSKHVYHSSLKHKMRC